MAFTVIDCDCPTAWVEPQCTTITVITHSGNAVQKLGHGLSSLEFSLLHTLKFDKHCVNLRDNTANRVLHPVNSSRQLCKLSITNLKQRCIRHEHCANNADKEMCLCFLTWHFIIYN